MKLPPFFKKYRLLLIIYGLAAVVTLVELTGGIYPEGKEPTIQHWEENQIYTEKKGQLESDLYPESGSACFYRGKQYLAARPPELEKARAEFEKGINRGIKSHEGLLNAYAVTLILLEEDDEKIKQAIHNWQWNHPLPAFPHPQLMADRLKAQLDAAKQ